MKTILFTLAIVTVTFLAHAQGTIWFGNSEHTRLAIGLSGGGTRLATADDNMFIGVFYGTEPSALVLAPGLATIGPEPGILVNAARTFPLPGTVPGQLVALQVRAWDAALGPDGWRQAREAAMESPNGWSCETGGRYFGQTKVTFLTVAPPDLGVGAIIWDASPGGDPIRLAPLDVVACPEPSTVAIGALGALLLVFCRRK